MVCSDGLTSMVREPKLKPLLVDNDRPLDELGRELIAAANAAGGRDNITVILFTLEEVDAPAAHAAGSAATAPKADITEDDTNEYDTFTGEAVSTPRQGVSRPQGRTRARRRGACPRRRAAPPTRPRPTTARRAPSPCPPCAHVRSRSRRARPTRRRGEPPRRRRRRIVTPGRLLALGCVIGLLAAFWLATRQVYFVGVDESRGNVVTLYHGLPYDLPLGIQLYSPVRHSGVTFEQVPREPARDVHRSQAALEGRRREPGPGARAGHGFSERAKPRVAGADPGVAAADGRLRRDLHPALGDPLGRLADLRRDLPRPVLRRPPGDPLHAAARRPVPVPARRRAGVLRARGRLPDRRGPRARPGAVVRDRPAVLRRRRSSCCATSACSSATGTRSRSPAWRCCCCRACRGSGSRSTAPTSASSSARSRSSPRSWARSRSSSSSPPTCATTARCWSRAGAGSSGVTIPQVKHLGPLLVVWGAAMLMLVFIRDLGSSLMYFGAFLALLYVATNRLSFVRRGDGDVRRRRVVLRVHGRPRAGPHRHLARPVPALRRRGLPDRQRAVRAGRRRVVRPRTGRGDPERARRRAADPGPGDRHDLRGHRQRPRARRRRRAARDLPADRRARLQDRDAGDATRSRSCSPPG